MFTGRRLEFSVKVGGKGLAGFFLYIDMMSWLSEGHRKKGEESRCQSQTSCSYLTPNFPKMDQSSHVSKASINILNTDKQIQSVHEAGNYKVGMRCGVEGARPK